MTLNERDVRRLLGPFELELTAEQTVQLLTYLELLLHWNRKINLTAIRTPEECLTRHFGESLYLARWVHLSGKLLDIGSGAGFPGLALKIAFPRLRVTLLEPVAKKRSFLKEVARACGMEDVEARPERLQEFQSQLAQPGQAGSTSSWFDSATARAVGDLGALVCLAGDHLKVGGGIYLWLSHDQGQRLLQLRPQPHSLIRWETPVAVPLSRQREIWVGTRSVGRPGTWDS